MKKKSEPKKIVYLFGAGATHAEKFLECKLKKFDFDKKGKLKTGLLAKNVSERVINKLLEKEPKILNNYGLNKSTFNKPLVKPNVDIELFISLIETIKNEQSENDAKTLRKYFKDDIVKYLLVKGKSVTPRLCASLVELHDLKGFDEKLTGFLTLNYDSLIENSFKLNEKEFDYGLDVEMEKSLGLPYQQGGTYVLKLHGSFDWGLNPDINKISVSSKGGKETMQWIPPKLNKEYLNYPYNIIHGKAYELLCQCDILRIIGCSLGQNDIGLISLLFKTQRSKKINPYSIEIIGSEERLKVLTERLGSMLSFDESFYRKDEWTKHEKSIDNSFLDWLYYKIENVPANKLKKTTYLKKVTKWIDL